MKKHLNLLPEQYLNQQAVIRACWCWAAISLLFGLTLYVFGHSHMKGASISSKHVAALEIELKPLKMVQRDVARQRLQLACLEQYVLTARQTMNLQPMLTLLSTIGSATQEPGIEIGIRVFELTKNPATNNRQINTGYVLSIKGVSVDNKSIARFTAALSKSNCFRDVELKTNKGVQISGQPARSYHVECSF